MQLKASNYHFFPEEEDRISDGRRPEGLLLAADRFLQKLSAGMAIADPTTLNPQVMRRPAFASLPLWVALGLAATGVLLFSRIDRRTHEANLALPEAGAPRFGLKAGTVVEEPDEADGYRYLGLSEG
jgi:hypothetical protein